MRTRFSIDVTGKDLARGVANVSNRCAVAQAIARQIPGSQRIDVDTQTIRFTLDKDRFVYLTPMSVQQYVSDYDAGLPIGDYAEPGKVCGPFTFRLDNPMRSPRQTGVRTASTTDGPARKGVNSRDLKGTGGRVYPEGSRQPPRKVFRVKTRAYGHRLLRWNQDEQIAGTEGTI
jgi:hypothetical protein